MFKGWPSPCVSSPEVYCSNKKGKQMPENSAKFYQCWWRKIHCLLFLSLFFPNKNCVDVKIWISFRCFNGGYFTLTFLFRHLAWVSFVPTAMCGWLEKEHLDLAYHWREDYIYFLLFFLTLPLFISTKTLGCSYSVKFLLYRLLYKLSHRQGWVTTLTVTSTLLYTFTTTGKNVAMYSSSRQMCQ